MVQLPLLLESLLDHAFIDHELHFYIEITDAGIGGIFYFYFYLLCCDLCTCAVLELETLPEEGTGVKDKI
jgi:hypothetical protein